MGLAPNGKRIRNGTDFWWDDFAGARGNCWFRNNRSGQFPTSSPSSLPNCADGKDPALSVGKGNPTNEGELLGCAAAFETRNFEQPSTCVWLTAPSKPSSSSSARVSKAQASRLAKIKEEFCEEYPTSGTCDSTFAGKLEFPRAFAYSKPAERPAGLRKKLNLQLYKCVDWKKASEAERRYVIYRLRQVTSGQVIGTGVRGYGTVIPDDKAHELFGEYCANDFARGFLLYKLHGFASVFVGGTP
jgi:hypothetical protein